MSEENEVVEEAVGSVEQVEAPEKPVKKKAPARKAAENTAEPAAEKPAESSDEQPAKPAEEKPAESPNKKPVEEAPSEQRRQAHGERQQRDRGRGKQGKKNRNGKNGGERNQPPPNVDNLPPFSLHEMQVTPINDIKEIAEKYEMQEYDGFSKHQLIFELLKIHGRRGGPLLGRGVLEILPDKAVLELGDDDLR